MTDPSSAATATDSLRVDRIVAESFVGRVDYHRDIASTNDRALQLAARDDLVRPLLVVAERQSAGRGRGGNRWWSADGALTFSVALREPVGGASLQTSCRVSLAAALAVGAAITDMIPGLPVRLKWPNDVYLSNRKVCGILVETTPPARAALVIGVGVNVNNSLRDAPEELRAKATSLIDAAAHPVSRTELLLHILRHLDSVLRELREGPFPLSDRWRDACLLQGRTVRLEAGGRHAIGVCQGIDDEGALLLQTDAGVARFLTGVVTRIL